jgi:hypothetical protein
LMNQIDFTINTCEKKTADDAKRGQAWAIKKLREALLFRRCAGCS